MAYEDHEPAMIEEVRRWRAEAYQAWQGRTLEERDAETRAIMEKHGLGRLIPAAPPASRGRTAESIEALRDDFPRAYEKWPPEEDESLTRLFKSGLTANEIAQRLQRQPSAVSARIFKLGLVA
jgi:DNA-directed RNA polymerase specialized sigma24 family protein